MPVRDGGGFKWYMLGVFFLMLPYAITGSKTFDSKNSCAKPLTTDRNSLRVIREFCSEETNEVPTGHNNISTPCPKDLQQYFLGTIIFVDCYDGYTAIRNGSLKYTCVKSNDTENANWDGILPECKRNICWWIRDETAVEFSYNGQLLKETHRGFPADTEVIFLDCLNKNDTRIRCDSFGNWSSTSHECIKEVSTTEKSVTQATSPAKEETSSTEQLNTANTEQQNVKSPIDVFLIWACIMTSICLAQAVFLTILCWRKLHSKRQKSRKQKSFLSCKRNSSDERREDRVYSSIDISYNEPRTLETLSPTYAEPTYSLIEKIALSSSKKKRNDAACSSFDTSYNEPRTLEVSSPTYEEPMYSLSEKTSLSAPIYAMPTPKPRKIVVAIDSTN